MPRQRLIRLALIVAGALALVWFSVAISVAAATRDHSAAIALRMWPYDGFAKATQASDMLTAQITPAGAEKAHSLALDALRSEPMAVKAVRVVGFVTETKGDRAAAKRQFELSRRITRRDLLTSIWFIEEAVTRNDTAGALRNYEIALRTSRSSQGILFPVLDRALAEEDLVLPISGLLASGQQWVPAFVEHVAKSGEQAGALTRALLARPASLRHLPEGLKAMLLAKLVDDEQFDVAERLYLRLAGKTVGGAFVRNGDFRTDGPWPPFDWSLISTADYGAGISPGSGLLSAYSRNGGSGTVARQVLALPPGAYSLDTVASLRAEVGVGSALWSVNCAGKDGARLTTVEVRPSNSASLSRSFTVPSGCSRQWLSLEMVSGGESNQLEAEFERVAIRRR